MNPLPGSVPIPTPQRMYPALLAALRYGGGSPRLSVSSSGHRGFLLLARPQAPPPLGARPEQGREGEAGVEQG